MNLSISFQSLIAQEGSQAAADVIEQSLRVSRDVSGAWNRSWNMLLQDANDLSLWSAIVKFALTIALFALIYFAVSQANNVFNTVSFTKVVEMFVTPLVVVFLLGGNGYMLAQIILMIRWVGRSMIADILQFQLGGIAMEQAIEQINFNQFAVARIRQLFAECSTLTGEPLRQCIESKQNEAQFMVDVMGRTAPVEAAQSFLDMIMAMSREAANLIESSGGNPNEMIAGAFAQVFQPAAIPIIQTILFGLQWAYANMLEAALLLTALFAPIAVSLMLIPIAGNALAMWFTGFVSILAIQLGYALLTGLTAGILAMADRANQSAISSAGDYGFLIFISIFSPVLATAIGKGGGQAAYQGISQKSAQIAQMGIQIIATGIKGAAGMF